MADFDLCDASERLKAWAARTPEVDYLAVFGSRVRGDYRPDSDLDIAIEVVGEGGEIATFIFGHTQWKAEIEKLLGFAPVHLTPRRDVVTCLMADNCVVLFERPPEPLDLSNVLTWDDDGNILPLRPPGA